MTAHAAAGATGHPGALHVITLAGKQVTAAGVFTVNSGGKLEVYCEDLRKMYSFAVHLRRAIADQDALE